MGHKEHGMTEILDILRRTKAGDGKRQIAKATGIDRNTIRKYLKIAEVCGFTPVSAPEALHEIALAVFRAVHHSTDTSASTNEELLLAHLERIKGWLDDGLTLTKVHLKLGRIGINVTYSALYRFSRAHLDFGANASTVRMAESAPGEVAEVDFGRLGLIPDPATGRNRILHALIVTLAMSRHQFVYMTHRQTAEALIAGIEAAWEFFGGVAKRVVIDNMKAAVIVPDRYQAIFNRIFLEYSNHRGFIIDAAPVRHPTAKAMVERQVPYVRENFFKGEQFTSRDHAQQEVYRWCRDTAGLRIHGTTRKRPLLVFEEQEKQHLLPLSAERFDVPVWAECKVHPDHHVRFGLALYSVPNRYLRQTVSVRGDSRLVRIYHDEELIKTHPKMAKGKRSTDYADYPAEKSAYAMRDCAYYIRKGGENGEAQTRFMEALFTGAFPWSKIREAQKLLRLAERYGKARVEAACNRALSFGLINIHRLEGMIVKAGNDAPRTTTPAQPIQLSARFERNASYFRHTTQNEKENGHEHNP